jgi:hypothetical protein
MPIVKMLQAMVSPTFNYVAGDLVDVSDEVATAWIGGLVAELHEDNPKKIKKLVDDVETYVQAHPVFEPPEQSEEEPTQPVGGETDGATND